MLLTFGFLTFGVSGCSFFADLDGYTFEDAGAGDSGACPDDDLDGVCNSVDRCLDRDDAIIGMACTAMVGACSADGTTQCAADGLPFCDATIVVEPREICGNGTDDDCDGSVDENCSCTYNADPGLNETRACGSDVGACNAGLETCQSGNAFGPCEGVIDPSPEVCGGGDEDCDGNVDEGGNACGGVCLLSSSFVPDASCDGTDTDLCQDGVQACVGWNSTTCTDDGAGVVEICDDAVDNDCDGFVDAELAHDYCETGVALSECDSCAALVCSVYPYCCFADSYWGGWDDVCVLQAQSDCALSCT